MRILIESDRDSLTVHNAYTGRSGELFVVHDTLAGLLGATGIRDDLADDPVSDGSFMPSRMLAASRVISFDVSARFHSSVDAMRMLDRVNDLAARPLTVVLDGPLGKRRTQAVLSDDPQVRLADARAWTLFTATITLTCPDPLWYGPAVAFTASDGVATVENNGTQASPPGVEVTGHVSVLTLSMGSHRVQWVGDADGLSFDFRDMLPDSGGFTVDDAFEIPPGRSRVNVTATEGATVRLLVRPAWR